MDARIYSGVMVAWLAVWLTSACGGIAVIDPGEAQQTASSSSGGFQTRCYSSAEALTLAEALEYAQSAPLSRDAKLVSVRSSNNGDLDRCGRGVLWELFYDGLVSVLVGPDGIEEVTSVNQPCDEEISPIDSAILLPDAAVRVAELDSTPATADGDTGYFLEEASLCGAHAFEIADHPLVTVLRQWKATNPSDSYYQFRIHYDKDGSFSKICGPCSSACSC